MHLTHTEFEKVVEEALADLPPQFAELLDNIAVVVEEEPSDEDLDLLEDDMDELLGIYRGIALTHRRFDMLPALHAAADPHDMLLVCGLRTGEGRDEDDC